MDILKNVLKKVKIKMRTANIDLDTDGAMREMAGFVDHYTGEKYGFIIMIFPFGENTSRVAHYISNCDRESMINALREKADVLEQNLDIDNKGAVQ